MDLKEKIKKVKEGYEVTTIGETSEAEIKQHLANITRLRDEYQKELETIDNVTELTEEQKKFKENLDFFDKLKAEEVVKAQIGNVDKRKSELKEALELIGIQIKNREALF